MAQGVLSDVEGRDARKSTTSDRPGTSSVSPAATVVALSPSSVVVSTTTFHWLPKDAGGIVNGSGS